MRRTVFCVLSCVLWVLALVPAVWMSPPPCEAGRGGAAPDRLDARLRRSDASAETSVEVIGRRVVWIVTWGDDIGRFNSNVGYGTHRQRWADVPGDPCAPPFAGAPLEYFETNADGDGDPDALDLDGDGQTEDDYVAAIRFRLDKPLSAPPWPGSATYPHPVCGRFFGGYTWKIANAQPRSHPVYTEIGINADHHWPYSDGRADDLPLKGMGDGRNPESFHVHHALHLWTKEDFLNAGDRLDVSLDGESRLAVMVNRYWEGFDDLRFVVRQGDEFYISEENFDELTSTGRLPKTFVLVPTETRWAVYRPGGPYHIAFDPEGAEFRPVAFRDVSAVGWYLAKNARKKAISHTKWYSFEARATISHPDEFVSDWLDTARVEGRAGVPAFRMSRTEIPYRLWKRVYRWADMPTYVLAPRYHFRRDGDLGSARLGPGPHSQDEPVTNLTIHDLAAWCNALSELDGRRPCYYTDANVTRVFRFDELTTRYVWKPHQARHLDNPTYLNHRGEEIAPLGTDGIPLPTLYVDWQGDGWRLPTAAEWREAYRQGQAALRARPPRREARARTQPVGAGQADRLGLRWLLGNVWEPVWTWGESYDPADDDRLLLLGGGPGFPGDPTAAGSAACADGDDVYGGAHHVGLRIVCREARRPMPSMGDLPPRLGATGPVDRDKPPAWLVRRGVRTGAHRDALPASEQRIEMRPVPAGSYLINPGTWHERKVTVSPFEMSVFAITYAQWSRLRSWAEARGFEFDRSGDVGSCYWSAGTSHTTDEPVTRVSLWDAMVFCNALSLREGRTPCYYTDPNRTVPLHKAFLQRPPRMPPPQYGAQPNYAPWVFVDWSADGYRLATLAEYHSAISPGRERIGRFPWGETFEAMDERVWHMWSRDANGRLAGKTHGSAETRARKRPNVLGLYDLAGNVYELCFSTLPGADPTRPERMDLRDPKHSRFWMYGTARYGHKLRGRGIAFGTSWRWGVPTCKRGLGPNSHQFGGGYRDEAMPETGFRVVRCQAGTHRPDGDEPLHAPTVLEIDPARYDPLDGACHRYSLLRNAVFPDPGVPDAARIGGRYATPGPVRSSPVVVDGIAYVGSRPKPGARRGALHAVDVETMRALWTVPIPAGVDSSACVHDGTVYVGGRDGKLYAVAAGRDGGEVRWSVQASPGPLDSSPGVAYGTVFVLVGGYGPHAGVRGFRAADGEMAYLYREHPWSAAAVCLTPTLALCTHAAGTRVSAGRLRDETNAWASPVPSYGRNDVVVADGVVYGVLGGGKIGGYREPGHIAAIDPNTGRQHWKRPLEAHIGETAYCFSSPVVWAGKVLVGMDNGYLHVYDAPTGRPTDWRIRATDQAGKPVAIRTSPSVSGPTGVVYFAADDGVMRAVDGRTGERRWSLALGDGPVTSSAWVAGRSILVGTPAGLVQIVPAPRSP